MSTEDRDDRSDGMSKFTGVKEQYEDWNRVFTAWEDSKDLGAATSVDRVNEMPTKQEYWLGVKAGVDPANGQAIQVPLTDVEKKLYKDNAASKAKLLRYVDKTLHGPMMAASGPTESVWLIKQWFQLEFGEVTAEDSLPELNRQKTELHPGDFKECMFYLGMLESINIKLGQIESTGK